MSDTMDRQPNTAGLSPRVANPTPGVAVDLADLPWAGQLVRDYCRDFERLAPFYAGPPAVAKTWRDVIAARGRQSIDRRPIAALLGQQLSQRDAPAAAREAAARLGQPGTVAIVTGQQAGLFGGPLLTILKAVTAVALARRVARDHDLTVVPIFWVDAEDHDLAEISSSAVLDADLALRRVRLPLPASSGRPAADVVLDASVGEAIATLYELLPPTEYTDETRRILVTAYQEGTRLVDAFARWMDAVLGTQGLVVFDASDPAAKPLARPIFEHELRERGETARLARASGARLAEAGYHVQVTPGDDAVALFELDGSREPIRLDGNGYLVGTRRCSSDSLIQQAADHPESFSPNVLLRPVVQDALFPTVGYVAGPNELAYLGQLRDVYARFDIPMPVMYPRASATLVDRATIKFLDRYDLAFETLYAQDDAALNRLLQAQLPESVERAVGETEVVLRERLGEIEAAVPVVDPTLTGAVNTTRGRMERDLRNLRGKIIQAAKRRDATLRRQFHRARAQSFPVGKPQERAVGAIYFLNRHGPALGERLITELPIELGRHWVLTP